MRALLGVIAKDLPRFAAAVARPGRGYLAARNRGERLEPGPDGLGWRCDWRWATDLHVVRFFPRAGRLLLRRALADHPVSFAEALPPHAGAPAVSFVIGHRGSERLPLLLATLRSIAGQRGPAVECVVVEHSDRALIAGALPGWVRYLHAPVLAERTPYSRSRTLNAGAAAARGRLLVLHDGDLLAPSGYATELLRLHGAGLEAINLKRFVLYLSAADTGKFITRGRLDGSETPESVVQNLQGGSIAIGRESFAAIGGMDEQFEGWGGEDNEFWERCALLRRWEYGSLALVHLWHQPQPEKAQWVAGAGPRRYRELQRLAPELRVAALLERRRSPAPGSAGTALTPPGPG